jgi:hypothetical protein
MDGYQKKSCVHATHTDIIKKFLDVVVLFLKNSQKFAKKKKK